MWTLSCVFYFSRTYRDAQHARWKGDYSIMQTTRENNLSELFFWRTCESLQIPRTRFTRYGRRTSCLFHLHRGGFKRRFSHETRFCTQYPWSCLRCTKPTVRAIDKKSFLSLSLSCKSLILYLVSGRIFVLGCVTNDLRQLIFVIKKNVKVFPLRWFIY